MDGGIPAIYAEAFARMQVECPDRIDERRWWRAIDDAGRFLDLWGRDAEALAWSAADLFAFNSPGASGLVWHLDGSPVVALTATAASIQMPSGSILSHYRPSSCHSQIIGAM
jgi:hypothetical protein